VRRYTSTHGAVRDVAVTAAVTATMRASIAFCLASTAAAFQSAAPQAHSTALCATRMRPVWKQISDAARHRRVVVPVTASASARWRGDYTPSTRRCPRNNCGGSMAWRSAIIHWLISHRQRRPQGRRRRIVTRVRTTGPRRPAHPVGTDLRGPEEQPEGQAAREGRLDRDPLQGRDDGRQRF
jgi:hypothetical protein